MAFIYGTAILISGRCQAKHEYTNSMTNKSHGALASGLNMPPHPNKCVCWMADQSDWRKWRHAITGFISSCLMGPLNHLFSPPHASQLLGVSHSEWSILCCLPTRLQTSSVSASAHKTSEDWWLRWGKVVSTSRRDAAVTNSQGSEHIQYKSVWAPNQVKHYLSHHAHALLPNPWSSHFSSPYISLALPDPSLLNFPSLVQLFRITSVTIKDVS